MSAMQNMGKSVMRVAKNSIKGYSDTQSKIRDATSNDPWGPSGTQMSEIAAMTFNQNDFVEIIEMLDKRLNDKGKNWRHVFKSLTVLDYILHAGSENVVQYFRENLYIIKTLKEFQYIDETGKDQGANVRQKAKDITNLLLDEKRMNSQRASRKDMRNRMAGERGEERRERPSRASPPAAGGGDADLQAAIEASKRSAQDEARKQRREQGDKDMEEAMRLSREEEERRQRELAANGGGGLFDDQQQNNSLIDMDSATQVQQPMQTGWQSFNPYAAQQQAQMEEYMRQQQLLELQRQQEQQQMLFAQQQQQAMQAQYAQQQAYEEHMRQQQMLYAQQLAQQPQQPIQPQATGFGANNPFAAFASPPPSSSPAPPVPQTSYQPPPPQPEPAAAASSPAPQTALAPQRTGPRFKAAGDAKHSELAQMLAGGREDGLDTFGNIGASRVPVWQQKTGQQVAAGQGPMMPQTTGLAKPLNPFGSATGNYQAPMQFNQPTGYQGQGQGQQQQQQQQQQSNDQPFFTI
ncbi:hypothetical protein JCM11641_002357 [Rhodosporidiobolus odoratus]